jgi:hypothetical protein
LPHASEQRLTWWLRREGLWVLAILLVEVGPARNASLESIFGALQTLAQGELPAGSGARTDEVNPCWVWITVVQTNACEEEQGGESEVQRVGLQRVGREERAVGRAAGPAKAEGKNSHLGDCVVRSRSSPGG